MHLDFKQKWTRNSPSVRRRKDTGGSKEKVGSSDSKRVARKTGEFPIHQRISGRSHFVLRVLHLAELEGEMKIITCNNRCPPRNAWRLFLFIARTDSRRGRRSWRGRSARAGSRARGTRRRRRVGNISTCDKIFRRILLSDLATLRQNS